MFKAKISGMQKELADQAERRKALRQRELFVLDNSLRESTVGQLRGHTIENKWKIYEEVRPTFAHKSPFRFAAETRAVQTSAASQIHSLTIVWLSYII